MKEIASLPSERKLWYLRKYYAGGDGVLPPTDPRILSMTKEQIELEFAHIELDRANKNGNKEAYEDDTYEDYDKESDEMDERLSDNFIPTTTTEAPKELPKDVETIDESEWEDVEIDDFDTSETE